MSERWKFGLQFYFQTIARLMWAPRRFFSDLSHEVGFLRSLGVLIVSSLFFGGAGIMNDTSENPLIKGGIFFTNAISMTFLAAGIGYMVMTMMLGRCVTFTKLFSVYALSSGVTLLASWIPFFVWLTEPWKWWLIGTGMTRYCGLQLKHAVTIIGITVCVLLLFFWSLLPVISSLKSIN
ncbi:MAG: YIP1 family protein [Thermodesulfobacteriota bacterium]|nr:YIP1 family protein [Thermodesulfobacteriota bacterium]